MQDIATSLYLSEAYYDLAVEAAALSDTEDWTNASVDEDYDLEEAGYGVGISYHGGECTEELVDLY